MSVETRIKQLGGIAALASGVDVSDAGMAAHLERAVEVAANLVCRFAPDAPLVVQQEAVWRCASWLIHSTRGSISRSETGPRATEYAVSQTGALRFSGAMSLLSPYKIRRAGAI